MKPSGGSEIQRWHLEENLKENELDGINLITSTCHPDLIDRSKINVVWQQLSWDQQNVQYMADRRFVDSVQYFVYNSHWCYQRFRERFAIPEYKSTVIKNATYKFDNVEKSKDGKIKLIYTSTPWRGLNVLLMAIQHLNKTRDDFEVDVYSSTKIYGSDFEKSEQDKFKPLFDACSNTKNINYKGYGTNEEIRKSLERAHIFSYPNNWEETSCIAAIEALTAGCYGVVTNFGALVETCTDFVTYVDYEPNVELLAQRYAIVLSKVIDKYKNNEYDNLLKQQVNYYNSFYSWDYRMLQWRDFFKSIKNGR